MAHWTKKNYDMLRLRSINGAVALSPGTHSHSPNNKNMSQMRQIVKMKPDVGVLEE